jgi:hypothetical protein
MTKRFLIFIPFHNPWDWHTDYANQTALRVSRFQTVFCFLWGDSVSIKEIITGKARYHPLRKKGNLLFYQPLFLIPGKRLLAVQFANLFFNLIVAHIICSLYALQTKRMLLFWYFGIYDPAFLLLPTFFRSTRTLYDCVDVPSHPDPAVSRTLLSAEQAILRRAWIVTANSTTLHTRLKNIRPDTHLLPLGFREEIFHHPKKLTLPFPKNARIICYIGAIDYRLDFSLLVRLVKRHPTWHVALVGPIFYDHLVDNDLRTLTTLLRSPNVYHDAVTADHIPDLLRQCTVTVIPYRTSLAFNRYAFPMKTMEYLYAQKRVITSPIVELQSYTPLIRTARGLTEWERLLAQALTTPLTPQEKLLARRIAKKHTWDKKISALLTLIAQTPEPGYGHNTSQR